MATADEILATMSAEEEKAYLVIESDLRTITIPDEIKILGVESDDDVLRLHFKMPKMYGEFDLSEFELRVNYMNANNEPDLYEVKDAAVSDDIIEFSWLVGRTAAKYKGDVRFIVCAKLMRADGVVEKEFNTTVAKLPVLEGLETSEAVAQLHPDVIEDILLRLSRLETNGAAIDDAQASAKTTYSSEKIEAKFGSLDFRWLGDNPIATTEEDTPAKWSELGTGYARFTASIMDKQPGIYGLLLNISRSGTTMQIFHITNAGPAYIRSGNLANGWNNKGWRRLAEDKYSGVTGGVDPDDIVPPTIEGAEGPAEVPDAETMSIYPYTRNLEITQCEPTEEYPNGYIEIEYEEVVDEGTNGPMVMITLPTKIPLPPAVDETLKVEGAAADAKVVGERLDRLNEDKADKAYMVNLFNELKALILNGDTSGAVALLDQAILDQSVLA